MHFTEDFSNNAYDKFFANIPKDALVITVTDRMYRHLLEKYLLWHQKTYKNNGAITSPFISFSEWKSKLIAALMPICEAQPLILSNEQLKLIWEDLLKKHPQASNMIYPKQCLKKLIQAWQYVTQWGCEDNFTSWQEQALTNEQIELFIDIANSFKSYCKDNNYICSSGVLEYLTEHIDILGKNKILPNNIIWLGFEMATPNFDNFKKSLEKFSGESECLWPIDIDLSTDNNIKIRAYECIDNLDEINQILSWAISESNLNSSSNSKKNIGVIIPNLSSRRDDLISAIENYDLRQNLSKENSNNFPSYAITGGVPLSSYPIVKDFFAILSAPTSHDLDIFRTILASSYILGANNSYAKRDQFDWNLQQKGRSNLNFLEFLELWINFQEQYQEQEQDLLLENLENKKLWISDISWRKHNHFASFWQQKILSLLEVFAWPGDMSLSSIEHQVVAKAYEIIQQSGKLDFIKDKITYIEYLRLLKEQFSECLFQPESAIAPQVTFFEILEADTIAFDSLWIAGVNDDIWPPKAKPNAFIPIIWQQKYKMPHSSNQRELEFALHIWRRLLKQAPNIILSSVSQEGGIDKTPSELIKAYGIKAASFCDLSENYFSDFEVFTKLTNKLTNKAVCFKDDSPAKTLTKEQLSDFSNGIDLIQKQIDCPFKAFARFRLDIEPFENEKEHLSASMRGQILHWIMADFWKLIKDSDNLNNLHNLNKLDEIIRNIINKVLKFWQKKAPELLFDGVFNIEKERLYLLVLAWLEVEVGREDSFSVINTEHKIQGDIAGLPIVARIDRIDSLFSGDKMIVDYKTGLASTASWFSSRPEAMQMPIYALLNLDAKSITFAHVQADVDKSCKYHGVSEKDLLVKGIKKVNESMTKDANCNTWGDLVSSWDEIAVSAVNNFKLGASEVDPKVEAKTCQYCEYRRLCRVSATK